MYRSRGDGEQNASVGKRQENDDFADSVYELYGKASDLCILFGCIFPDYAALVMIGLYVLGIVMGIIMALLFKGTMFKGEPVPFVMELPNYRLPGMKNVGQLLWEKRKIFFRELLRLFSRRRS